jgi:hypothetical protein
MARSMVSASESDRPGRLNLAVEQAHLADAEPSTKARMLRELAAWYRALAARAANPVIWESRLLTADIWTRRPAGSVSNRMVNDQNFRRKETSDEPTREEGYLR